MKKLLHSGPGIVIGLPTLGRPVSLDWALAFKSLNPPINFNSLFQVIQGKEIGAARQEIAELAVEKETKYIFFIGDDVVIPSHALRHLIYFMEHHSEIGVIGGVYCAKAVPAYPLVFRGNGQGSFWDWKIGEFFEVTGLGMDCTLIRTEILSKMEKPWFKTVDGDRFLDGVNEAESWTEDLHFCNKVLKETDYKIYCDAGVICDHIDVYGGKKYNLPPGSLPMRQKATIGDKKALLIGMSLPLSDDYDVTTFGYEGADYRGSVKSLPFDSDQYDLTIQTNTNLDFAIDFQELLRVTKKGGKVNILPAPFMDEKLMLEFFSRSNMGLAAQKDGNYIEITK